MILEIHAKDKRAHIDSAGGYVLDFSDLHGNMLFPKTIITTDTNEQKARGGCHVCLPNFGPGGDSGLEQHGYGRVREWNIEKSSENFVELSLAGEGGYEHLYSKLIYRISEDGLLLTLELRNTGEQPLLVGPAFHPYFLTDHSLRVDDEVCDLGAFQEMKLSHRTTRRKLATNGRVLTLISDDMPYWAHWSDRLQNYFCVEPTYGGNTFLENSPRPSEVLSAGATSSYSFEIRTS